MTTNAVEPTVSVLTSLGFAYNYLRDAKQELVFLSKQTGSNSIVLAIVLAAVDEISQAQADIDNVGKALAQIQPINGELTA